MARRLAVAGLAAGLAVAGGGAGWWAGHRPHPVAAAATVPTATAVVRRTDLASTTQFDGVLGYAGAYVVVVQGRGGTVTALPAPGRTIARGQRLYELDGHPVRLFYGARPAWRRLAVGVASGSDIRQLERNLVALGYSRLVPDDRFTWATAAAVRRWQRGTGQRVTGTVALGALCYLPGPVRVTAAAVPLGAPVGAGTAVLRGTSTTPVVTVPVPAAQTYLVHVGDRVQVTLPSGTGTAGRVSALSTVATAPPGNRDGSLPTVPAVVSLADPSAAGHLDQAPVTVVVTTRVVHGVLAVPVTALVPVTGGGYGVYRRAAGTRRLVEVTPGVFAGPLVEVRGGGLRPGDTVEVPAA